MTNGCNHRPGKHGTTGVTFACVDCAAVVHCDTWEALRTARDAAETTPNEAAIKACYEGVAPCAPGCDGFGTQLPTPDATTPAADPEDATDAAAARASLAEPGSVPWEVVKARAADPVATAVASERARCSTLVFDLIKEAQQIKEWAVAGWMCRARQAIESGKERVDAGTPGGGR